MDFPAATFSLIFVEEMSACLSFDDLKKVLKKNASAESIVKFNQMELENDTDSLQAFFASEKSQQVLLYRQRSSVILMWCGHSQH